MNEIFDFGYSAFLGGSKTVVFSDSREMVGDSNTPVLAIEPVNKKTPIDFVKRGVSNKLPIEVMDKIYGLPTLGANVAFNAKMAYGDGIMVVKKIRNEAGLVEFQEQLPSDADAKPIFDFLAENNYVNAVQEWAMDIVAFHEAYCEFIFDKAGNNIVSLNPVESVNSRLSVADEKSGEILWHGYSTHWQDGNPDDVVISPLMNRRSPIRDLKIRRGIIPNLKGKTEIPKDFRYLLQLMQPTPGRYYHGKPYWWAIFESGWYDFAVAIPKFKRALLQNQMTLKYKVDISTAFWPKLFKSKGIAESEKEKVKAAKLEFLTNLDKFLSGAENSGKSFVSEYEYDRIKGFEIHDIIIAPIESFFKGGEYLEDSEEVTNVICYAMEIHPSIIGATGKKGSINGTEARELFIIKQALMKPVRDLMVLPLYIVKAINKWPDDIHFVIPNIMLTTLDENTGAEKSIGNQKV